MKKIASFLVACSMVLGLAGCAGSPVSSSAAGAGSSAAGSAAASTAGSAASAEGMKIVFVSSPSGVDDGSFVQNSYEGVLNFIDSRGSIDTVTDIVEPTGDTTAAVQAVADVIADYDVIVTPGFQFAGIGTLAQENPDKQFILIDTVATDESGNVAELDNVTSLIFAEEEGGFFAGLAAALTTKTGKVASVHGVAFESNVNYQYGFESGVKYANEHYGTTAEVVEIAAYAGTDSTGNNVGGNYVGKFDDPATGKIIGQTLIGEGCDVLFAVAGDSGNGVLTEAN